MAKRAAKRIRTPEQQAAKLAREIGIPESQIARGGIRTEDVVDLKTKKSIGKTIRILYPTIVDRWLAEGGPGFEEPQRRAVEHCRGLWALIGTQRLCANYGDSVQGGSDEGRAGEVFALSQLAEYKKDIPSAYWSCFENVVRFDMPAGTAGSHLAKNPAQQQAHAKNCVGFVASLIAQWRGY